jgi:competence protein ComEC
MRRPLPKIACSLAAGIALAEMLGFWAAVCAAGVCLSAIALARWRGWLANAGWALGGVVWLLVMSPVWPGSYGKVDSSFTVRQVQRSGEWTSMTVSVRTLSGRRVPSWNRVNAVIYLQGESGFLPGDVLQGEVDWQQPALPMNPGEFNYHAYQRRQGVLATAFLPDSQGLRLVQERGLPRWQLRSSLEKRALSLPGTAGELLATLLLGRPAGDWALSWRQAGVAHLLAVSGLHVGLLLGLLVGLLGLVRLPRRWYPISSAILLVAYGCLVGPRPSVWRAIVMCLIGILATVTKRLRDWQSALAAAAILLLIYNPWFLFDAGWQLSFAAAWGVLALSPLVARHLHFLPRRLAQVVSAALAAQAATLPLVLYHFYLLTPLAIFSNLLLIPMFPVLLAVGVLYLCCAPLFTRVIACLYQAILRLVDWLAEIPAMSFSTGQPPVPLVMLAVVLIFLLWRLQSPRQRAWLFTGWLTVILLALSWQPLSRFVLNRYQLSVLSVGQGVSTVLHLPGGKALLFDVGGAGDRVGENIIVPYLRHQGTLSVGGIFLSHFDHDHVCGLRAVLEAFSVEQIYVSHLADKQDWYGELTMLAETFDVPVDTLWAGDSLVEQALRISVLHPTAALAQSPNEDSLVLQLSWPNLQVLLPGDIGSYTEAAVLPRVKQPLDILLVAHHGSAGSSHEQWLSALRPTVSIISTGANRYGHPAPAALMRLHRYSGRVLRTDHSGAISVWTDLRRYRVREWRGSGR